MKYFRLALAGFALMALAACYPPTTRAPVGLVAGLKSDPLLTGLWKAQPASSSDRGAYLHFLPHTDGGDNAILIESGHAPDADWYFIAMTTGRAGANRFINAKLLTGNGKPEQGAPPGTIPLLYKVDAKGQVQLFMMDEKATKAAIKAGKIKGSVENGDMGDATITADPVTMDKFMQSPAGLALFSKLLFTLHKME